jgi:hypothetical protein
MTQWIAGVDQSLTYTAVVCMSVDAWDTQQPWALIHSSSVHTLPCQTLKSEVGRRAYIADELVKFLRRHDIHHVALESPAYAAYQQKHTLPLLAIMLDRIVAAGMEPWIAPQTQARKLLLGDCGRKKGYLKVRVRKVLGEPPDSRPWGYDESDALCVANWLISELGGKALAA